MKTLSKIRYFYLWKFLLNKDSKIKPQPNVIVFRNVKLEIKKNDDP